MGKVLGQLAIVLVYTRTVLKTQYKTQFFKDTAHFQLYYTQKQLSSIILRGDIQRMPQIGPILTLPLARPVAFDASRAGYGSAALLGIVVQPFKQEQQ